MQATLATVPASKPMLWTSRVVSALPVLFLVMDGAVKLANIQPVVDASMQLGLPAGVAPGLGVLLLACLAMYLIPRSSVLGAILLTGYLGGAMSIQMRVGAELFSLLFPLILGVLLWGGLYLRDGQLRGLISVRR